jgi:DNA-binding NarL/FixJ family response regulator
MTIYAEVPALPERRRPPLEPVRPGHVPLRATIRAVVVSTDAAQREDLASRAAHQDVAVIAASGSLAAAGVGADVVVVGHRLPGGSAVEACEQLAGRGRPAVVVVAPAPRAALLRRVLQAGAAAFVAAESPASVLRDAIRSAAAGRPYVDPSLGRLVVELVARTPTERRPYGLTRAQLDVVALLPRGLRNREIAVELGITENTVKTHLRHALRKLRVRDRAQAAALVMREGLG